MSRGRRHKKKNFTSNDDGKKGNKRTKKTTGGEANKNNNANGVMVSERRSTRGHPMVNNTNQSGSGKVPKNLAPYLEAGPSEAQSNRLMNPGRCSIRGCKLTTTIPVKCETTNDSTMNETCKKVCHHECAKEADLISVFGNAYLYCSNKCKAKGDKYRDEELQNATPKGNTTKKKKTTSTTRASTPRVGGSNRRDDEAFILSQNSTTTSSSNDDDDDLTGNYEPRSTTKRQTKRTKIRKNSSNANNNTSSTDYEELLTNGEFPVSLRVGWKELERVNGTVTSPEKDDDYIHFLKSDLTTNSSFDDVKQLHEKSGCSFFYNNTERSVDPGVTTDIKTKKDTSYRLTSTILNEEDYCTAISTSSLRLDASKLPDDAPITVDAACEKDDDELDDDADDNNDSPVVFHLDIVVLVSNKPGFTGGRALSNKKLHSKIKCIVTNITAKVVGSGDGDEKYMLSPRKDYEIGSFLVDKEKFCVTFKYGSVRQSMLKVYKDDDKGDLIGKHSSIFIKYDNRSSVMNRVTSSEALLQQYTAILGKQNSKAVSGVFTIKLSLGKKKNDDTPLDYQPEQTQLHHNESQQVKYQSPAKEASRSRAARRSDSRVLSENNDDILELFDQVSALDKYKNKMAQQHKVAFILHLSNHTEEQDTIASDLSAGRTPKLVFMKKYAEMLSLIMPGDVDFGPTVEGDELPNIGVITSTKTDDDPLNKLASSVHALVESKKAAAAPPKATAIRFIKYGEGIHDSFHSGDEIHQVTILDTAVGGDNGMALLLAASTQAHLDGSLVFSLTSKKTDKSYNRYKFRGLNPVSNQFKSMSLDTILTGTAGTLEIVVSHHEKKDILSANVLI